MPPQILLGGLAGLFLRTGPNMATPFKPASVKDCPPEDVSLAA